MNKELCNCGKVAVWWYAPGYEGKENDNSHYCEDCVSRGCDCNENSVNPNSYDPPLSAPILPEGIEGKDWKWIKVNEIWCHIDDQGREYPCCEYWYSEEGWEIENEDENSSNSTR